MKSLLKRSCQIIAPLILCVLSFGQALADDYGDAPASYGDASTAINTSVYLGVSQPDSEAAGQPGNRATNDGVEEDGAPSDFTGAAYFARFPLLLETASSYTTAITVNNTSGSDATLEAWIDFDHSGTFDSGELATVNVSTGTTGPVDVTWSSLSGIEAGTTYIRLRLTDATGAGEVEDHVIGIAFPIPAESPSVTVIPDVSPMECQSTVFEDDFNDLPEWTSVAPNRTGSSSVRNWTLTGGGEDTYATVNNISGYGSVVYLGNGMVRRIDTPPNLGSGFTFDANNRLTTTINAMELRSDPDDINLGTTEYEADWGPEPLVFTRSFSSEVGKTYRLYFTSIPEASSGQDYLPGIMRVDTPAGSAHFKIPFIPQNGNEADYAVNYAIEFTATSTSSAISFVNYGHFGGDVGGICNPQEQNSWCTIGGYSISAGSGEAKLDNIKLVESACETGTLTLLKDVTDGSAIDTEWTLSATDGPTTGVSGAEGTTSVTNATVFTGTYNLVESNGPSGYVQTGLACTGAVDADPSDGITIAKDENVICTFTNAVYVAPVLSCPAGSSLLSQIGNATSVVRSNGLNNPERATGALASSGSGVWSNNSSVQIWGNGGTVDLDLGVLVPQSDTITASVGRGGSDGVLEIYASADDITYTLIGSYGDSGSITPTVGNSNLDHITLTVPAGGAQYIRFTRNANNDMFVDGVEYSQICGVAIVDPTVTSVSDLTVVEGTDLVQTVTLSAATEQSVSYAFSLVDGTATEATDYDNTPTFNNGVTYDSNTGEITVPTGVTDFTVSYPTIIDSIDDAGETTTLSVGGETGIGTINNYVAPILSCPAGSSLVSQTGNAVSVVRSSSLNNPERATGTLASSGSNAWSGASLQIWGNGGSIDVDLGAVVPQNDTITVSVGRGGSDGVLEIYGSADDVTYTLIGTYGDSGSITPTVSANNIEHVSVTVPAGGAQYIRFTRNANNDMFVDGVEYSQICEVAVEPTVTPFPEGPGLVNSVCNADAAGNAYADIFVRWEHNINNGTSPAAKIDNTTVIQSATDETYVGLNAQINGWDLNIDRSTIPANYDANKYISYSFTTKDFSGQIAELYGFAAASFEAAHSGHNQDTGAYKVALLIDDDATFSSPDVLINEVAFDDGVVADADAFSGPQDHGSTLYTIAHYNADNIVTLASNTTYYLRVYPYGDTKSGMDAGQPYSDVVLWDDFMLKAVNCSEPVAAVDYSDAPSSGTSPDGSGTNNYGSASHTIDSTLFLGATAPDADASSQPTANADGDDTNGTDDDDGVSAFPVLTESDTSYSIPAANLTASGTGTLHAWLDFDGDGSFESTEYTSTTVTAGVIASDLDWTAQTTMGTGGSTFARFRFTSDSSITASTPEGLATDGEVEDYIVAVAGPSFPAVDASVKYCSAATTDTNFTDYRVSWSYNTPTNTLLADHTGGNWPNNQFDSSVMSAANIQTVGYGMTYGFDGDKQTVIHLSGVDQADADGAFSNGDYIEYEFVTQSTMNLAQLFNGFAFASHNYVENYKISLLLSEDNFATATTLLSDYSVVPASGGYEWIDEATDKPIYLKPNTSYKFRVLFYGANNASAVYWDDFHVSMGVCQDYSDAPTSSYGATSHDIPRDETLFLGTAKADAESGSRDGGDAGVGADGDDTSGATPDDEEGVAAFATITAGDTSYTVLASDITAAGTGTLHAWIDFNGDGAFGNTEYATTSITSGVLASDLNWTGLSTVTAGDTYARFRVTTDPLSATDANTNASDGEIEDYTVAIEESRVALVTVCVDADHNNAADPGEMLLVNVESVMTDSDGEVLGTAISNSEGVATFNNLPIGTGYKLTVYNGDSVVAEESNIEITDEPVLEFLSPVDPSGKIYNSVTRALIADAVVEMTNTVGTVLPAACFLTGQQPQTTDVDGYYRFDVVPGADALCPVTETDYLISVTSPAGYSPPTSTIITPQSGAYNPSGSGVNEIVPNVDRPLDAEPTTYYMAFRLEAGDPNSTNNHIPLDPITQLGSNFTSKLSTDTPVCTPTDTITSVASNVEIRNAAGVPYASSPAQLTVGDFIIYEDVLTGYSPAAGIDVVFELVSYDLNSAGASAATGCSSLSRARGALSLGECC